MEKGNYKKKIKKRSTMEEIVEIRKNKLKNIRKGRK